jgi:hypothetical protein
MKNNIIIFIIILLIIIQYWIIFLKYYQNTYKYNKKEHNTNEVPYGHYSSIGKNNIILYPSLIFTSPIYFTLKENESLIIPKHWWHWISSNTQTIAVNFWVQKDFVDYKKPQKIYTSFQNNNLIANLLLNYDKPLDFYDKNKANYIKKLIYELDNNTNNYLLTVPYLLDNKNKHINNTFHNICGNYINVPDFVKNNNYQYNIWYATGNHETGLHYDDNDNLLTVIKGTKNVILYPPFDSKYLQPYSIIPKWANTKAIKFEYNLYKYLGELDNSLPSSRLLYELIHYFNNKKMLQIITSIINDIGSNKLIYGCKIENGIFRSELYLYYHPILNNDNLKTYQIYKNEYINEYINNNKNTVITSFDLYNNDNIEGNEVHFYHNINTKNEFPYYGYCSKINNKNDIIKEGIYILDKSENVKKNLKQFIQYLNFENYNLDIIIKIINIYDCKEIAMYNKYDNNYFIQYLDITFDNFIDFLKTNNYPKKFINHVIDNSDKYKNLKHEITIVFDKDGKIIRTSFYGLL